MQRSFYLLMMIFIAVLVLYGFSHTVDADIFNPPQPPPMVLYVHVAVFTGWLAVVITQSALIRTHNLRLHKRVGWLGLGFGMLMVAVGLAVTLIMGHEHVLRDGPQACMFIYRPLEDILFFGVLFGLAIHWRKRPDFHRRLMLLAAIIVTPPAISRIPGIHPLSLVYAATDLLIVAGVLHDLITMKRVHAVYLWAGPIIVIGQAALLTVLSLRPASLFQLALAITR